MKGAARYIQAQAAMELRLTARRGESVLVTLVLPLLLLLFLGSTGLFAQREQRPIDVLTPGLMALAIISSSLVSLGIATAYERHYGVLKRLGGTPLTPAHLVTAKMLAVLVLEAVQLGLIAIVAAVVFGWRAAGSLPVSIAVVILGTAAFAGLGLALAGTLRAEAVLALTNGLFLVFMLTGGIVVPMSTLPPLVAAIAAWLPAASLADALRAAVTGAPMPWDSVLVLAAWAVGTWLVTARTFRWDEYT